MSASEHGLSVMDISSLQERFKDTQFRNQDHSFTFCNICDMLRRISLPIEQNNTNLLDIFRMLRNSCINCRKNQDDILKSGISEITIGLLTDKNWDCESGYKAIMAGLQFLGNFVAGNSEAQSLLWSHGFPQFFTHFLVLNSEHHNLFTICAMIFYNCLSNARVDQLFSDPDIIITLCNSVRILSNSDWVILCITEHFLNNLNFLPLVMSKCSHDTRCHILQLYCDWMSEKHESVHSENSDFTAVYLVRLFLEEYSKLADGKSDLDFFTILLKALCWATALQGSWTQKTEVSDLVHISVKLLRKLTCKPSENESIFFSVITHFSKSFCRRDLIRLLGNLCFENVFIQGQIRSLGGIPLILEACNIDDGNPFMQQWAVFAVRNLCQGNPANQDEIAKLEKLGVADSPVLRNMGLTAVEDNNGKMRVVPMKK